MKKSDGFGLIPALVAVAIIAVVAVTGVFVYRHSHKTTNNSSASNTSSNTQSQAADPYAGWKTYKSSVEGFSIRYPSDWQLTDTLDPRDTNTKESVSVQGPNNFTLKYDVYKLNSNSSFGCDGCAYNGVTKLSSSNYGKDLYIVVNSQTVNGQPYQTLSISEYTDIQAQPIKSWPYYTSKSQTGYVVRWSGNYVKPAQAGGVLIYSTYDNFSKQSEVTTAISILQSLSY